MIAKRCALRNPAPLPAFALALVAVVIVVWLFGRILGMALPRGPWGW
jgi:hypothetical protein